MTRTPKLKHKYREKKEGEKRCGIAEGGGNSTDFEYVGDMPKKFKPVQWDGCGCVWYEKGRRRKLSKCDLHKENPTAFGGLLITIKNKNLEK